MTAGNFVSRHYDSLLVKVGLGVQQMTMASPLLLTGKGIQSLLGETGPPGIYNILRRCYHCWQSVFAV